MSRTEAARYDWDIENPRGTRTRWACTEPGRNGRFCRLTSPDTDYVFSTSVEVADDLRFPWPSKGMLSRS